MADYELAFRVTVYNKNRAGEKVFSVLYDEYTDATTVGDYIKKYIALTELEEYGVTLTEVMIHKKLDMEYVKDLIEGYVL